MVIDILTWVLDVVNISLILVCFVIQAERMHRRDGMRKMRKYFILFLVLFTIQNLLHLYEDLTIGFSSKVYNTVDRAITLAMTIVAIKVYTGIRSKTT